MAYHFFSIPVCGSPNVGELNQLLDHGKVASVKREFVQERLPPRPQLRPRPPNGEIRCSTGTEPAADPLPGDRDKTHPAPIRASRLAEAKSKTRIGVTFSDDHR